MDLPPKCSFCEEPAGTGLDEEGEPMELGEWCRSQAELDWMERGSRLPGGIYSNPEPYPERSCGEWFPLCERHYRLIPPGPRLCPECRSKLRN